MTVDEFKMIAKQYGFELNPLLESMGDYSKIFKTKKEFIDWLDEVTERIHVYKRIIKLNQIKSIADGETID